MNRKTKKLKDKLDKENAGKKKFDIYKFSKILAIVYVVFFVAFEVVLAVMNILPIVLFILVTLLLLGLGAILFMQLYSPKVKKWARIFSIVMSIFLIIVYGFVVLYGCGTLSFLSRVTTGNKNSVNVTKEPFSVLVTGIDTWGDIDDVGRSDVDMVITVNPTTGRLLMTSIPRDYWIRVEEADFMGDKITHTGIYGVDCTISAVEDLLNTKINYYVKVNFSTVCDFVDAIGGVDVYSSQAFESTIANYSYDKGKNHLSGTSALYFARERHSFENGDNQRAANQQKVVKAIINKATNSKTVLLSYNKVLNAMKDSMIMNMSSREVRSLIRMQLTKNIKWEMESNVLEGYGMTTAGTYSLGNHECYVTAQSTNSVALAQAKIQAIIDGNSSKDVTLESLGLDPNNDSKVPAVRTPGIKPSSSEEESPQPAETTKPKKEEEVVTPTEPEDEPDPVDPTPVDPVDPTPSE